MPLSKHHKLICIIDILSMVTLSVLYIYIFFLFKVFSFWHPATHGKQALHHQSRGVCLCHSQHLPGYHLHFLFFSPNLWNQARLNVVKKCLYFGWDIHSKNPLIFWWLGWRCTLLNSSNLFLFLPDTGHSHFVRFICSHACSWHSFSFHCRMSWTQIVRLALAAPILQWSMSAYKKETCMCC